MAKYAQIVFMQGEEAAEVGNMMNDNGVAAVVEYLAQWDMGEYHEVRAESAASGADMFSRSHREGDYQQGGG